MNALNEKPEYTSRSMNENLGLLVALSIGIFLFILFFQPFPLGNFKFDNTLVFVAGFGAITFIFTFLLINLYPFINTLRKVEHFFPVFLGDLIYVVVSSAAYSFYLGFVGNVSISFYTVFRIVFICVLPVIVLRIYNRISELHRQNIRIVNEKKELLRRIDSYENELLNKPVEFISDNKAENFSLQAGEIVLIKSADNYVEIVYKEADQIKKKLVRTTMKNVELQLKQFSNFLRCHRVCIVNITYVTRLTSKFSNYFLVLRDYQEEIPVSRQYLIKLKEAL